MSSCKGNPTGLPVIHERAAGIDIGSRFHVVAVGAELCEEPVQTFQAFTSDLQRMADWRVGAGAVDRGDRATVAILPRRFRARPPC